MTRRQIIALAFGFAIIPLSLMAAQLKGSGALAPAPGVDCATVKWTMEADAARLNVDFPYSGTIKMGPAPAPGVVKTLLINGDCAYEITVTRRKKTAEDVPEIVIPDFPKRQ